MNIIGIDESFFQDLCCVKCKQFLSVPISGCSDGLICGNCTVDEKSITLPIFDSLLRNVIFSCKYKKYGCVEDLEYGFVSEHESKCEYQKASCVVEDCKWKGLLIDLSVHIPNAHQKAMLPSPEIMLNEAKDISRNFFYFQNDVLFIIRCNYNSAIGTLSFNVTYISAFINTATYSILNGIQEVVKGDIQSYQPDTPTNVYATELKVEENVKKLSIKIVFHNYTRYTIQVSNNDLLCKQGEELSASSVLAYNPQPVRVMCDSCFPETSSNSFITVRVKSSYSFCKWKKCHFIFKTSKLYLHEETCPFYLYSCSIDQCSATVRSEKMSIHLQGIHLYKSLDKDGHINLERNDSKKIFCKKYNTFYLICCERDDKANVKVQLTSLGPCKNVGAYVTFRHSHCRIKSKTFLIIKNCTIGGDLLPECFSKARYVYLDVYIAKFK